jgi:hypothetical protein
LRTSKNGRLAIDRAKIKAEERLDGKYLLTSPDPHLTTEEIAVGYKALLETERGFRDLTTVLELRWAFHHLEHRIRAHVLLCRLALLSSASPNAAPARPGTESAPSSAASARSPSRRRRTDPQITPLSSEQAALYRDCGIKPPPRITAADPT